MPTVLVQPKVLAIKINKLDKDNRDYNRLDYKLI